VLPCRTDVVDRGGHRMIKKLFYAVLSFWLLKKYVLPYVNKRREQSAGGE
jgi:hypothetical protein